MLAQSDDTLYVAFMGTKQFRDVLTNVDARLVRLWPDEVICLRHRSRASCQPRPRMHATPALFTASLLCIFPAFFPMLPHCHQPCKA